jgi:ABC-type Mn2+/Zn2+ transport system permease subunit
MIFAVFSAVAGILTSYSFNVAPGGMIVLISIILFGGSLGIKSFTQKKRVLVLNKEATKLS